LIFGYFVITTLNFIGKIMKKLSVLLTLLLASSATLAGGSIPTHPLDLAPTQTQEQTATASSTSNAVANGSTINNNVRGGGYGSRQSVDLGRLVPSVQAPNMAVGFFSCTKSVTGSVNFGGFGAGLGIPLADDKCDTRQDAQTMKNLGYQAIAKETMCANTNIFRASYRAGRPCFPSDEMLSELSPAELEAYEAMQADSAAARQADIDAAAAAQAAADQASYEANIKEMQELSQK
jgi:hypothetical protein